MEFTSLFSGAILGAFITAIIAALLSGYFNIKTKNKEYENSYAKMILEKRLFAYEQINLIINKLKESTLDSDGKAYHIIFFSKENFNSFFYR
jgi:formiminotetrahydrofolate cyclodeaminase